MIDRIGLAFGMGCIIGFTAAIIMGFIGAFWYEMQERIDKKEWRSEMIPEKIEQSKAKNASEASYIEGWNDCIEKLTEDVNG